MKAIIATFALACHGATLAPTPTCVPLNGACSCPLGTVPAPGGGPIIECVPPDAPPPVPRLCVVSLTYLVNLPPGGGLNPIVARDPAAECADDATLDLAIAIVDSIEEQFAIVIGARLA